MISKATQIAETERQFGLDVSVEDAIKELKFGLVEVCLLYTSPSPRDATLSRMPSSA